MPSAWHTILGFEGLCVDFTSSSYSLDDFAAIYTMKKILSGVHFFGPRASWSKLIVNLTESDHGWNSTIVQVSGLSEAIVKSSHGNVPRA